MLGMIDSVVHLHEIIITESTFIITEKIVVMLKFNYSEKFTVQQKRTSV